MATETRTFYPGEYEDSSSTAYGFTNPSNPVGKGSTNTTYAEFLTRKYQSSYVYWPFDTSIIPDNATIDSVTCTVKARCSSATNSSGSVQLYSGTVAKGSATSVSSDNTSSAMMLSISPGTWTRQELASIRLRTDAKSGSYVTSFYFYGADLTVTYTYQSEKFILKLGGAWHDAASVFKKVNGIWVEQESLEGVVDTSKKLVNGGEIN